MRRSFIIAALITQSIAIAVLGTWLYAMLTYKDLVDERQGLCRQEQIWIAQYADDQSKLSEACMDSLSKILEGLSLRGDAVDSFLMSYRGGKKVKYGIGGGQ